MHLVKNIMLGIVVRGGTLYPTFSLGLIKFYHFLGLELAVSEHRLRLLGMIPVSLSEVVAKKEHAY